MSRRKFIAFVLTGVLLSTFGTITLFALGDLYIHLRHQVNKTGMYNIWGYRGAILGKKRKGEKRVAVVGGSTALGWGAPVGASFPFYLELELNKRRKAKIPGPVSVANLAWNNQGAYSFVSTLEDYAYLDYDAVIFYSGYNDLGSSNKSIFRRQSTIFRLTGYLPLLPALMADKAKMLRAGLGIDDINHGKKRTNFVPGIMDRTKAAALEVGAQVARSLEQQLGRLTDPDQVEARIQGVGCGKRWAFYCRHLHAAVTHALERDKRILVVTQPYISDGHVDQQKRLIGMLRVSFGKAPGFHYVNLGRIIDLKNRAFAFDGMHLTPAGNRIIAEALVPSTMNLLK